MPIRQSVVYPMIKPDSMALADLCREAKAIGFEAIELWDYDDTLGDVVETARSAGLRVCSMVGHDHTDPKLGSHSEAFSRAHNHDRLEAQLREAIDLAVEFDIPGLITLSGHRNPGETDYETLEVCATGLERICPYAEEKGINLNMELLNSRIDHPHYVCDRTAWAVALCERVGSPRCKILYDIYHMSIMEGDLIRTLRKAMPHIGHFHTAGNPGRNNLDDTQEIHYPGVAAAIAATDYDLYLGHEFVPRGDALDALRQAYSACEVLTNPGNSLTIGPRDPAKELS
jgi:hydroxypyruvate isomerase